MIIGIIYIAIGIILMAVFGAIGNYHIQQARTESASNIKNDIINNQDSSKSEILNKSESNKEEIIKKIERKLETNSTEENIVESEDQKGGITANKVNPNTIIKPNPVVNKVTSINQQGGITANEVNIYNKEPKVPVRERIKTLLNKIHPNIIKSFENGNEEIHIYITQYNLSKLKDLEPEMSEFKLIKLIDRGSTMIGFGTLEKGTIQDINQTQSGYSNLFTIKKLESFEQ